MHPFTTLVSRAVVLAADDVDTDQIIPARFLTTTARAGLGPHCFADWRYDASGAPRPDFVLNRPDAAGAHILVAGRNFGCGSSREHAPWALLDAGFRAIVATSFADIFRANALNVGLLAVRVDAAYHRTLVASLALAPETPLTIDLEARTLATPWAPPAAFPVDPFARRCMLEGVDPLGWLLGHGDAIAQHERTHAGAIRTVA